MKFVDTGAWYASYIKSDPAHAAIKPLIDDSDDILITTDFVLAELLNLLRARREFHRAVILGKRLLSGGTVKLIHVTTTDLEKAFVYFSSQSSHEWSFTDCTSLVVMQRLDIKIAIALDHHFRQMPGIQVEP